MTYEIPLISLTEKEIKRYLRNQEKQAKQQKQEEPEPETKVISLEYEKLSAEERQELNMKNKILDDWLNYRCQEKPKGKTLAEIDEDYVNFIQLQYPDLQISVRSIQRWDKTRRTKGEAGLVDSRGKHGNHKSKMTQVIADIFEFYYLDESRKSAAMCMKLTELEIKKLAKEDPTLQVLLDNFPALRTFERWVEEKIPYPVVQYFRYGSKACKDKCLPYIHRNYEDLYSNDIWVCDNHTFDVIIQKDEKPLRVYLTAFLDIRSRKVVGHYVALNPSSDATLYALRNGIENYGIPKRILADNGREFLTFDIGGRGFRKHSKASELDPANIMERLGIDFHTALVRNARAKIIERTFLTVKEEFSKLFLAYTGGNTQERPERLKYIGKDLTKQVILEDFETFVKQYIEGYYNQRENTGIGMHGMTPNQVYKKYLVEQRVAPQEVLNLMMLRSTRLAEGTESRCEADILRQRYLVQGSGTDGGALRGKGVCAVRSAASGNRKSLRRTGSLHLNCNAGQGTGLLRIQGRRCSEDEGTEAVREDRQVLQEGQADQGDGRSGSYHGSRSGQPEDRGAPEPGYHPDHEVPGRRVQRAVHPAGRWRRCAGLGGSERADQKLKKFKKYKEFGFLILLPAGVTACRRTWHRSAPLIQKK